ncbi:MAG TPA: ChbG/HpnK family deacetylase [Candidatus Methylomirabilis sp.]|jgi:hopanoid biosynthesis associated protein HpnK
MKRLIVNADDFGLCASVNRGILEAHRGGIVTSATLLAGAPGFEDAVALARGAPGLGVGVHMNLTRGRPVSPPSRIPTLVGDDGLFAHTPWTLALGHLGRRIALDEVEREWAAQIDRVRDVGITPTHLDSEKHIHLLPGLLDVTLGLARDHGIGAIRAGAEPGLWTRLAPINPQWYKTCGVAVLGRRARRHARAGGRQTPDRVLGVLHGGRLSEDRLVGLLDLVGLGVTELICHPGYDSPELRRLVAETGGGYLLVAREAEVRALTAPRVRGALRERGIELIHYGML